MREEYLREALRKVQWYVIDAYFRLSACYLLLQLSNYLLRAALHSPGAWPAAGLLLYRHHGGLEAIYVRSSRLSVGQ